ncbi:hypothetical protein [Kibdelosporangium phytohabitans]|uniref:hypothetical protein n=1 Tax=Kibdelosporangium phytohabitans TaxID=860235 RepID=UPI0012F7132E|nr:hypothetical protein [Kibdelosporangium phytohabitans]MBE1462618.1 hypothetical protein [Kibdelosporangium phytohabitans]
MTANSRRFARHCREHFVDSPLDEAAGTTTTGLEQPIETTTVSAQEGTAAPTLD